MCLANVLCRRDTATGVRSPLRCSIGRQHSTHPELATERESEDIGFVLGQSVGANVDDNLPAGCNFVRLDLSRSIFTLASGSTATRSITTWASGIRFASTEYLEHRLNTRHDVVR
jgi:hypothetical protein